MVNKCAAINCRSGYAKGKKDFSITFHPFSFNDEKLLQHWVETNCKKKFQSIKECQNLFPSFKAEDFVFDSADQQDRRKRKRGKIKLVKRRLKDKAYPYIFNNLPAYYTYKSIPARSGVASCSSRHEAYYTYKSIPARSGVASCSSRHENAAARLEEQCNTFLNADKIENFNDLLEKIFKEIHHQKYLLHQTDVGVNLFYLLPQQPFSFKALIFINADLEVTNHQKQQVMLSSSYQHIISDNKITPIPQVKNLMALAKNEKESKTKRTEKFLLNINRLLNKFFFLPKMTQLDLSSSL